MANYKKLLKNSSILYFSSNCGTNNDNKPVTAKPFMKDCVKEIVNESKSQDQSNVPIQVDNFKKANKPPTNDSGIGSDLEISAIGLDLEPYDHESDNLIQKMETKNGLKSKGHNDSGLSDDEKVSTDLESLKDYDIIESEEQKNLTNPDVGGLAIALTHGSIMWEVARQELHATTALKNPNRFNPTRIGIVFYQHR